MCHKCLVLTVKTNDKIGLQLQMLWRNLNRGTGFLDHSITQWKRVYEISFLCFAAFPRYDDLKSESYYFWPLSFNIFALGEPWWTYFPKLLMPCDTGDWILHEIALSRPRCRFYSITCSWYVVTVWPAWVVLNRIELCGTRRWVHPEGHRSPQTSDGTWLEAQLWDVRRSTPVHDAWTSCSML